MSNTPTLPPPPPGDDGQATAAKVHALLDKFGLLRAFEGAAQALEGTPAPSTQTEALHVLTAQLTHDIDAEDGGESKDAAAAETISVFVETQVRSLV